MKNKERKGKNMVVGPPPKVTSPALPGRPARFLPPSPAAGE